MNKSLEIAIGVDLSRLSAGLGRAATQVKAFGAQVGKDVGDAPSQALDKVGTASLIMGGAIVAGFGMAVHAAMGFDKQLSQVQAVTGATADEMAGLRQLALDLGQSSVFSASETAAAITELGKAGLTATQIMGGAADAAVNLAAAGGVELAQAAEIAASAMTQFGLSAGEVPRVADLLAGAANASQASVEGLGVALGYVGPVANAAGMSIDDAAVALGLLAKGGIDASTSGTSLRSILVALQPQSERARTAMQELGLVTADGGNAFFDASGKIKPFGEIVEILNGSLGNLTEQQRLAYAEAIFGREALASLNVIASTTTDQYAELSAVIGNTSAAEQAATMTDNLAGDLEQLGGAIETALIQGGGMATDALRQIAQGLTNVVSGLGEMPAPLQLAFLGSTGLIGVGSTAVGVYGTLAPKFREVKASLMEMGSAGQFVAGNMGKIAAGAGVLGIALAGLSWWYGEQAAAAAEAEAMADRFTDAIERQTGALEMRVFEQTLKEFADQGIGDMLKDTTADVDLFARSIVDAGDQIERFSVRSGGASEWGEFEKEMRAAAAAGSELGAEMLRLYESGELSAEKLQDLAPKLRAVAEAYAEGASDAEVNAAMHNVLAEAQTETGKTAGDAATGIGEVGAAAGEAVDPVKELDEALQDLLGGAFGIRASVDDVHESLNGLAEGAKKVREEGGGDFFGMSDAAISFRRDLDGVTTDIAEVATTMAENKRPIGEINAMVAELGGAFLRSAEAAGVPKEVTDQWAATIAAIPTTVASEFQAPGLAEANAGSEALIGNMATVALGAEGIVATPGVDGAITLTDTLGRQLAVVDEGASGEVAVPGADGAFWKVVNVNGQLAAVRSNHHGIVTVDTGAAEAKLANIIRLQNLVRSGGGIPDPSNYAGVTSAHGNLFPPGSPIVAFAAGGFFGTHENHQPQIARPGVTRIWNEPEAGGEAYIPFATDRRPRAQAIWIEAGRHLGMIASGAGAAQPVVNVQVSASFPNYLGNRRELEQAMKAAAVAATPEISDALRDRSRSGR